MAIVTGCYLDQHRHSAIVVRVKEGRVTYLTMNETKLDLSVQGKRAYSTVNQRVDVFTVGEQTFAHQFEQFLPDYPIKRALRVYWRSGLAVTKAAEEVMVRVLKALRDRETNKVSA